MRLRTLPPLLTYLLIGNSHSYCYISTAFTIRPFSFSRIHYSMH